MWKKCPFTLAGRNVISYSNYGKQKSSLKNKNESPDDLTICFLIWSKGN